MDTKKKERVGPFKNGGRAWRPAKTPQRVRVHDFVIRGAAGGKAIPYGVYDLQRDEGWVSVGIDHDYFLTSPYVPPEQNPRQRSITELEYREAVERMKPRLLFIVADDTAWPPKFVDKGDAAARLKALRDKRGADRLASFFASEHELAELVTAAVDK